MKKVLEQFEEAWRTTVPTIEAFLAAAPDGPARRELLGELVRIDLECRWSRADQGRLRLEDYVRRYPELGPLDRLPVDLIGEEYRVRWRWGDHPAHAEYTERFAAQGAKVGEALRGIDAELADEFGRPPAAGTAAGPVASIQSSRSAVTVAALVDTLCRGPFLSAGQQEPLKRELQARFPEVRALGKELLRRNWLTPYQLNQLLQGRGAELVVGPYLVSERLGEGGTGQVFKARHQKLGREVALKLLRKELLAEPDVLQRFYREIQVLSRLDHPHIVHAYDAGPAGQTHFLAMEYIEGTDLSRLVKQSGPLPVAQAGDYIRQAALGLHYAHERGLIHRDIKPSNLFLTAVKDRKATAAGNGPWTTDRGLIKVLDLGLARLQRAGVNDSTPAISTGTEPAQTLTPVNAVMMGTADYMAPEQALDFHQADIRSDIYSLGCTFYCLLAGRPPFAGSTVVQKLWQHQQAEAPPVEASRSDVPPELAALLRRMLAKRPEDRFQTAGEVAAALNAWANGDGSVAFKAVTRKRRWPILGRRRFLVAVLSVPVIGGVGFLLWPRSAPFDRLDPDRIPADIRKGLPKGIGTAVVAVWGRQGIGIVNSVAVSADGKWVASGGTDKTVHVWDVAKNREHVGLEHSGAVVAVAFSPDARTLVSVYHDSAYDALLQLWDVDSGRRRGDPWTGMSRYHRTLTFAPDGKTLAWEGSQEYVIRLLAFPSGHERDVLKGNTFHAFATAFSPDGALFASISNQGLRLWNMGSHPPEPLPIVENPGQALAFSPDGAKLAVGGDRGVKLWDVTDLSRGRGKEQVLKFGPGTVSCLTFAADGRMLTSGVAMGMSRLVLWDKTFKDKSEWTLEGLRVASATFAPDGRHVITANDDGTVYVLRLSWPPVPR